ncbi:hypothetical protein [Polaribacter sp. NJDZ03]|uniref:hypothetical protein n=1 Tax=Polaribacter sp. NJDZ03 TaxID=2855841 RepID=UPI001C4A59EF|nr:hypothetical protein [Polaribacter sp. NJDZ03]
MKKTLFYYFIFSISTGTFIYFCSFFNVQLPRIVRHYVNDFLIIPIVLYICLYVLKWSKNDKKYTLSLPIILYVCFLYSLLFEFIFSTYLARYTKDFIDIILYFTSGFIFYYFQKTKK